MSTEPTALQWVRDIAENGMGPMSVWLREDSDHGDLYPETLAEVLAEIDRLRAIEAAARRLVNDYGHVEPLLMSNLRIALSSG